MNNETTLPEETSVDQETGTFSDQETGTLPDQETESLSDQEAGTVIVTGEDYTEVLTEIKSKTSKPSIALFTGRAQRHKAYDVLLPRRLSLPAL